LGGGASEASHVPFLPQFTGDECEDRVRIAPAGSVPLRSPLVPPVEDCVPSRHPLGRVHNIADVPANLFSERVGDDDVVDGFSFLVAEECQPQYITGAKMKYIFILYLFDAMDIVTIFYRVSRIFNII